MEYSVIIHFELVQIRRELIELCKNKDIYKDNSGTVVTYV